MVEQGADDMPDTAHMGGRPSAASVIAELWSERETSSSSPPSAPAARPPRSPGRDGSKAAVGLGVAVALLLGSGVGMVAARSSGQQSRAGFVAEADAACQTANGVVTAITKPTSYPDLATAAGTLVTATDTQLGSLRTLKLPRGSAGDQAVAVLAAMSDTNEASRRLQDAAGRKDDAATAAATQRMRASAADASTKAGAMGLSACAGGMQPGVDAVAGGANGVVKTAFVANADNLCRAAARDMDAIRPPRREPRDALRYLEENMDLWDKVSLELKALPVPPGDESAIAETMGLMDTISAKGKEMRAALLDLDTSRLVAIEQEVVVLGTAVDAKLDAYGLETCGSHFGSL